jgi:hypothetical protein
MKRPATSSDAVDLLLQRLPELGPLHAEHLSDFGELLPYPLVEGDFSRCLQPCPYRRGSPP